MIADERAILRRLAGKYMELTLNSAEDRKRDVWRHLNSLKTLRPPIYVRAFAWDEMPDAELLCHDPVLRTAENFFRAEIFKSAFGDDSIFEPWYPLYPEYRQNGWGLDSKLNYAGNEEIKGAFKEENPIKELSDIARLQAPVHLIDEDASLRNFEKLYTAIGDIIPIYQVRRPAYWVWSGDISTIMGHLRGIENIMYDMMDNPEWLHSLLSYDNFPLRYRRKV